jgi:hypothetical protein
LRAFDPLRPFDTLDPLALYSLSTFCALRPINALSALRPLRTFRALRAVSLLGALRLLLLACLGTGFAVAISSALSCKRTGQRHAGNPGDQKYLASHY